MRGIKKFISVAVAVLMSVGIFAGCAPEDPPVNEHEHTYASQWSSDGDYHWHAATCEHTGEVSGKAAHEYNAQGDCTACGYHKHVYSDVWTFNSQTHWHADTCGHGTRSGEEAHKPNAAGTACSVCGLEAVSNTRKPVSTAPFKDSYEIGDVRVQLLSDTLVRIENKGGKGFENRESYIVTNRLEWKGAAAEKVEENGVTKIKSEHYTVVVPDGGKAENAYITDAAGKTIWTYTGRTDTNVYIPSPSDELKSWHFTDSPRIIPSYEGYSDGAAQPLQGWDFDSKATDIFVFLPQGDYERFCTDYVNLTGKTEMVNLSTLGFWDSRYYAYTSETALQQIKDYREKGYAIDVLVIDTDWRKSSGNTSGMGYDINTSLFPNMAEFLKQCEELGVEICFNDHPTPVQGTNNGLDKNEVDYRNDKLTLLLSLGVDYWWYDRNWSTSLNSCDPEISVYAFGMYAYQWITQDYYSEIADIFEYARRAVIMGNVDGCLNGEWKYASDISAHRYSIQWSGDTFSGMDDLAQEIYAAVMGGAEVGLPYISADLGGHNGGLTDEAYIRWMQYGLLSSIARVHCVNSQPGRMPWIYGDKAEEVFKVYQDMRYRLLPLYYSLARENYDTGLPLMRRLDVKYPQYAESSRNDQYLLGDYIVIAPLSETNSDPLEQQKKKPDTLFTHEENGTQVPGLKGEYRDSMRFSGNVKVTRTDLDINFDWGEGKADPAMNNVDNFTVVWTGKINIGSKPAKLAFLADDTVKVYIDGDEAIPEVNSKTYCYTPLFKANSKHDIEIRYSEHDGEAFIYSFYMEQESESRCNAAREIFLPEGTWIDVWTGQRYSGPVTKILSYSLETSPIFVREGALVTLAENGKNAADSDWSKTTLDVYPSTNFTAKTRLYEDDTKTVAYRDGKFRTTDISMNYDKTKKAVIVTLNAAEGGFEGACEERTWNIRVHKNPGWDNLTEVKVNGTALSASEIKNFAKSAEAKPFATSGAAADGEIYEFTLKGSVKAAYQIELYFGTTADSAVNTEYDDTETPFTLSAKGAVSSVNLSQSGTAGWVSYGDKESADAVSGGSEIFGYPQTRTSGSGDAALQTKTSIAPCAGTVSKSYSANGLNYSGKEAVYTNQFFNFTIETVGQKAEYVLILGGCYSTAKVTVRDRAGNVQTVYFGNIDGEWTQKVVIECPETADGTLYVSFAAVATSKRDSGGYANEALLKDERALMLYGCYAQTKN